MLNRIGKMFEKKVGKTLKGDVVEENLRMFEVMHGKKSKY